MATTYIAAQSHGSWGGTPRAASNQYIQDEIDAGSPGDTYILQSGTHRGQSFTLQTGDTLLLAEGAILNGAEDIGTGGWTFSGGEWYKAVSISENQSTAVCKAAYACGDIEALILDGVIYPWYSSSGADADGGYHDGTNAWIGIDPSTLDTIEIARVGSIDGPGVEIGGETVAERGKVRGYATYSGGVGGEAIGLSGSTVLIHDLEVSACSGGAIGCWDNTTVRNVTAHSNGQLAIYGSGESDYPGPITVAEGCHFYQNGIGGWDNGFEGGNSKFAWTDTVTIYGSLWDIGPAIWGDDPTAPLWFDYNCEGAVIYSCICRDEYGLAGRGLFLEVTYSGKIYNNILYGLSHGAESEGWSNAITFDGVGPNDEPSGPYSYDYSTFEVYGNLAYKCGGGLGGVQNRPDYNDGILRFGYGVNSWWDIHDNTLYFDGSSGFDEECGARQWNTENDAQAHDISYDDNIYLSNDAVAFNDPTQGAFNGEGLTWAQWNSAGYDTGTRAAHTVAGDYDPDPFNGGAM